MAKNGDFQRIVSSITSAAINAENVEDLLNKDINGSTVQDIITNHIATIGENLSLRRMIKFSGKDISTYIHNSVGEGLGRLAVLVSFEGGNFDLARQVAMHIAASNPIAISEQDIDLAVLEREKNIFIQQMLFLFSSLIIIVSMIPAGLVGFFYEDKINQLFNGNLILVGSMLIITSLLLFISDKMNDLNKKISTKNAIITGIAQALAILPGISRSGSTIATSLFLYARYSYPQGLITTTSSWLLSINFVI